MRKILKIVNFLLLCSCSLFSYARTARIYGYVVDQDNIGIELANVAVLNADRPIGTATNKNGYYELLLDETDTVVLAYSMIGYTTVQQRIFDVRDVININVQMLTDEQVLTEIEVRGIKHTQGTMDHIDASTTRVMPDATGGSIESLLITFAGVSQTNELSSQYNVRGGSFDENSVYVNGIEVHRPLLIRSGQQEGLSFVNPEMVENVHFSAGGYGAQYGDKMASVLDITYKRPTAFEASLSASLLGAQLYVGHGDSTYSMMHGLRYKTSKYMLGGLATTGNYQPTYLDYQTYITWKLKSGKLKVERSRLDESTKSNWSMSFLGNVSQNDYRFTPDSLSESFGGQNAKTLNIYYEGQEKDRFLTAFAALSAKNERLMAEGERLMFNIDLSGYYSNERELFAHGPARSVRSDGHARHRYLSPARAERPRGECHHARASRRMEARTEHLVLGRERSGGTDSRLYQRVGMARLGGLFDARRRPLDGVVLHPARALRHDDRAHTSLPAERA